MAHSQKTASSSWLQEDDDDSDESALEVRNEPQVGKKRPLESDSAAPPATPVRLTPPLDPATIPRLRSSISSHDRLVADDSVLPDPPSRTMDPREDGSIFAPTVGTGAEIDFVEMEVVAAATSSHPSPHLLDLPDEVQQRVLDMLMGELGATASWVGRGDKSRTLRNWNSVMRHPRSRGVSQLARVCPRWRYMVQERIYRHIKIEGTVEAVRAVWEWFLDRRELASYVRHVEFWVPIWQRRGGAQAAWTNGNAAAAAVAAASAAAASAQLPNQLQSQLQLGQAEPQDAPGVLYCMASGKSTLDELFDVVANLFPSACILTIEGGQCKKPPQIEHFRRLLATPADMVAAVNIRTSATPNQLMPGLREKMYGFAPQRRLQMLPRVHTLILRGAWNVMRAENDFNNLREALPSLREWHASYAKPKFKAYRSMYAVVQCLPPTLTHLNLSLDAFSQKSTLAPHKAQTLYRDAHLCEPLGDLLPDLEVVTLSGRFCACLLERAIRSATQPGRPRPRLRALDIAVKNVCRPPHDAWSDGAGIHNWGFILAFEAFVHAAVCSLAYLPNLVSLRIRYVDLDADCPLLHPYFVLARGECTGLWSPDILRDLERARPGVAFADLSDSLEEPESPSPKDVVTQPHQNQSPWPAQRGSARAAAARHASRLSGPAGGQGSPARRPRSIRVGMYANFAEGGLIH